MRVYKRFLMGRCVCVCVYVVNICVQYVLVCVRTLSLCECEPKEQSRSHPARIISSIIKSCEYVNCLHRTPLLPFCLFHSHCLSASIMAPHLSVSSLRLCRMLMAFIVKLMAVLHST